MTGTRVWGEWANWIKGDLERISSSIDVPIEFHILYLNNTWLDESTDTKRVFIDLWEPPAICSPEDKIEEKLEKFDLVITKFPGLLERHPGKCLFHPDLNVGGWMKPQGEPVEKEASISFLTGKTSDISGLSGYIDRRHMWNHRKYLDGLPQRFFTSTRGNQDCLEGLNPLPDDDRSILYRSMFNICIENSRHENYFTEKIKDCFATRTVPIYVGCPNIGKFFNIEGIIVADNWHRAIDICRCLTPDDYRNRKESIEDNLGKVSKIDMVVKLEEILRERLTTGR